MNQFHFLSSLRLFLEQIGWAVEMGNQRLMEVSRWKLTSNRSHLLWNEGKTTVDVIFFICLLYYGINI